MDEREYSQAADDLWSAQTSAEPIAPLTDRWPEMTVTDAYAIQTLNVRRRLAHHGQIVGHKVGLTSKAMQEMLGVQEPDFGVLLADMMFSHGSTLEISDFLQPRVEVEIAFRLSSDLSESPVTMSTVLAATEAVAPAIEVIDSRVAGWRIRLADTIADNASSAAVVLGPWARTDTAGDLAGATAELSVNGNTVATGRGSDVLGHPAQAVAWLANALIAFGTPLLAGHVVMPGSCTRAVDVAAGDSVRGSFRDIGDVLVDFT